MIKGITNAQRADVAYGGTSEQSVKILGFANNADNTGLVVYNNGDTALSNIPTLNLSTGVMTIPAGITGYYTSTEVDTKINNILGNVETLLSEV